uniref:Phospholipid-transporting ATPase n=1 Tax=Albugo laibachii Nc14 TaxID=890382 RepID=F0WTN9_9STRA|nr:Ptype ATPase (PATPase) Superfamily putative [Albugo laibachii Nc14]|eukprot:CCA24731.1 Ptype ATPase (PATPase) Superfamily putative [Albugo laibachii Nc14]
MIQSSLNVFLHSCQQKIDRVFFNRSGEPGREYLPVVKLIFYNRTQSMAASDNERRHIAFDRKSLHKAQEHTANSTSSHNNAKKHSISPFASNIVISSKYTIYTFLPRVLYAQLKRPSNLYFLFIAMLQSIKEISNTNGFPTILLPLCVVFLCSALKEALEDRERHRADRITNQKRVVALDTSSDWRTKHWEEIQVGDIIRVDQGQTIPADLVLLYIESKKDRSAEQVLTEIDGLEHRESAHQNQCADAVAYVETKSLDGETNLKLRTANPIIGQLCENSDDFLLKLAGSIDCDPPNDRINVFGGYMTLRVSRSEGERAGVRASTSPDQDRNDAKTYKVIQHSENSTRIQVPLTSKQTLLRSCVLRNTRSVVGIVIYTGHETKVFCSNKSPQVKVSSVERRLNTLIIVIVCIQQAVCFLGALFGASWILYRGWNHWYLHIDDEIAINLNDSSHTATFSLAELMRLHLRYFIIMQNFVPISLNVSLEFVKYWQAYFMQQDLTMYDPISDSPAIVRSSALNEDLGRVHHIFTDKTGTLTQNLMVFRYCFIGNKNYGGQLEESQSEDENASPLNPENPFVQFDPLELLADASRQDAQSEMIGLFLRHLALCHTLLPTNSFNETCSAAVPVYSASSPDELALASAAALCNVRFVHRTLTSMVLLEPGYSSPRLYKLLETLEFDSDRKRMSVFVETPENHVLLLCKGADSVIFQRLNRHKQKENKQEAYKQLSAYAKCGMRTLCLAYKALQREEFEEWHNRYLASQSLKGDASGQSTETSDVHAIVDEMERDMSYLGVTAVQDKLQDGVPKTLELFRQTHMKIWTLTGDKVETAINIGHASCLLSHNMTVKQITTEDYQSTSRALHALATQFHAKGAFKGHSDSRARLAKNHFASQLRQGGFWQHLGLKLKQIFRFRNAGPRKRSRLSSSSGQHSFEDHERVPAEQQTLLGSAEGRHDCADFALVIDGYSLEYALSPRLRKVFHSITQKSTTVICCRASPKQKANVVELVRLMEPNSVTLAIGDGANDVGMIQAAHIGIGISGKEGTQAVNASDYAIAEFRFLQRLLFVHGRWAYRRVTKLMCYMLYKNVTYVLTTFWFGFVCGFSGQPLIVDVAAQSFNVLYTSLPLILFAVFDQDVSSESASKVPSLYALGQQNVLLKRRVFWPWILNGIWHSIVIFFLSAFTVYGTKWLHDSVGSINPSGIDQNGTMDGINTIGLIVFTNLVIIVNLKLCLETFLITWPFVLTVLISIALWFLVGNLISSPRIGVLYAVGEMPHLQHRSSFWILIILTSAIALFRDCLWKLLRRIAFPSTYHILQEREKLCLTTSPRSLFPSLGKSRSRADLQVPFFEYARKLCADEVEDDLQHSSLSEKLIESSKQSEAHRLRVRGASMVSVSSDTTCSLKEKKPEPRDVLEDSKSFDVGSYFRQNKEEYFGYAFSEDENVERKAETPSIPFVRHSDRSLSPKNRRRSLKKLIKSVRGPKNA